MAPIEPTTEAARQWMAAHPKEMARIEAGIKHREELKKKRRKRAERPVEVTIRFKCLPSDLSDIKAVLKSLPTSDRFINTRPVSEAEKLDDEGREGA